MHKIAQAFWVVENADWNDLLSGSCALTPQLGYILAHPAFRIFHTPSAQEGCGEVYIKLVLIADCRYALAKILELSHIPRPVIGFQVVLH